MTIDDRDKPSGALARRLLRTSRAATLATLDAETGGAPYASLAQVACGPDGAPLLLLSDLARHSRNLAHDPRISVLFSKVSAEAVSLSRVSVLGRAERCDDGSLRARFMRRHYAARDYLSFDDFHLYRVAVEAAHFIGGFGRIETLDGASVMFGTAGMEALAAAEGEIVDHMNADHADALQLYAHNLAGRLGLGWRMTGIDPEGLDLTRHDTETRIDFADPVANPESAREALVRLAKKARGDI